MEQPEIQLHSEWQLIIDQAQWLRDIDIKPRDIHTLSLGVLVDRLDDFLDLSDKKQDVLKICFSIHAYEEWYRRNAGNFSGDVLANVEKIKNSISGTLSQLNAFTLEGSRTGAPMKLLDPPRGVVESSSFASRSNPFSEFFQEESLLSDLMNREVIDRFLTSRLAQYHSGKYPDIKELAIESGIDDALRRAYSPPDSNYAKYFHTIFQPIVSSSEIMITLR